MEVLKITFLSSLALEMLGTLSTALVAVQIGLRLLHGGIPYEQALFILVITPEFYLPLRNLGLRYHAAMNGVGAAGRIFSILAIPEMGHTSSGSANELLDGREKIPDSKINIEFRNVSFERGDRNEQVLENINCRFPANQVTALAGLSGAGKTTLTQLLMGFLIPKTGEILINGSLLSKVQSNPGAGRSPGCLSKPVFLRIQFWPTSWLPGGMPPKSKWRRLPEERASMT